ncbi:MAG: hypothetical protein Q9171_007103 [Xanthocarpia ochracea]
MVRLIQSLGFIIPFRILLAATIPGSSEPSTLALNPSNNATPTNQTIYHAPFQYTAPLDADQEVKCSEEYGIDVDPTSCFDAWQRFRWQDERVFTFGQRGLTPKPQQILPMRISSRDGRCAIDIVHGYNALTSDIATFEDIRQAATKAMEGCVENPRPGSGEPFTRRGGYVGGVGNDGNLIVVVRKYEPNVICGLPWRSTHACKPILDKMYVTTVEERFGLPGEGQVSTLLPSLWRSGQFYEMVDVYDSSLRIGWCEEVHTSCMARVDVDSRQRWDYVSWFDIWAAGEAIAAMCVWRRREGVAGSLGTLLDTFRIRKIRFRTWSE